jgi:glucosamine-6-phosphate isomerase
MKLEIFEDYNIMSAAAADIIISIVNKKPGAVLCFATGNTPVLTYQLLAQKAKENKTDFSLCFCIGLDEWLGVLPDKIGSCHFSLYQQIFQPLGIAEQQIHLFDGMSRDVESECRKMNDVIDQKGGIDFILAGVGLNGHIGFNEPGVDITLNAHEQELHTTTLTSGQKYFNEVTAIKKGITVGMAQAMKAGTLLLLANGKNKASIMQLAIEGEVTNKVPASFIQQHTNGVVMLDREAASALSK